MRFLILLIMSCWLLAPAPGQISKSLKKIKKEVDKGKEVLGERGLSQEEVVAGLKEALVKGARTGSDKAS